MKLTAIQVAGLEAEAACPPSEIAKSLQTSTALAYKRGILDGRAELARELIQEANHRAATSLGLYVSPELCTRREAPGACPCANCVEERHGK
jgi:AraC-like DNA-binding protein